MEDNFKNTVIDLFNQNKWKEILKLNEDSKNDLARNLLWVWPSEGNLHFIQKTVTENHLKEIISVGCGCGLLEWLIQQQGIPVTGIEVNKEWWKSRYCNPHFIELKYVIEPIDITRFSLKDKALLFCYFNNGSAFIEYVNNFSGNMIIIIGPGKGRGTLTNPEPFNPNFGTTKWKLQKYQEIKNTKDFIAVYLRNKYVNLTI